MTTPTPRTDAAELDLHTHIATVGIPPNRKVVTKYVPSHFARQLETELASAVQSAKDSALNFRRCDVERLEALSQLRTARAAAFEEAALTLVCGRDNNVALLRAKAAAIRSGK